MIAPLIFRVGKHITPEINVSRAVDIQNIFYFFPTPSELRELTISKLEKSNILMKSIGFDSFGSETSRIMFKITKTTGESCVIFLVSKKLIFLHMVLGTLIK